MVKLIYKRIRLYMLYKKHVKMIKQNRLVSEMRYKKDIEKLEKEIHLEELEYFYNQTLFIFCPNCGDELISQATEFKRIESNNKGISVDIYTCSKCNKDCKFVNGIGPTPLLTTDEEIEKILD